MFKYVGEILRVCGDGHHPKASLVQGTSYLLCSLELHIAQDGDEQISWNTDRLPGGVEERNMSSCQVLACVSPRVHGCRSWVVQETSDHVCKNTNE